jgi:hypothetical protein
MKTNSNFDSFYKPGTANSIGLREQVRSCENLNYKTRTNFGKKKRANFIQEANERSRRKGTVGTFTRWCKSHGYPMVNTACIQAGKRSGSVLTRKRAVYAQNIRSKSQTYQFGKKIYKTKGTLKSVLNDIKELKKI